MANHKSAIKRHRQSIKRRDSNRSKKAASRTAVRDALTLAAEGKKPEAVLAARKAESLLASAGRKGIIHPRAAARKISRLTKRTAKK